MADISCPPDGSRKAPEGTLLPAVTSVAHYITEFGELEANAVVHLSSSHDFHHEPTIPVQGLGATGTQTEKQRSGAQVSSALKSLFRRPKLQQFFYNDVLFRHKHGRSVSREELFLDLVLVAGIATLGHHLRAAPLSWALIESFMLLFFVIYAAWRHIVLLWNYWGVNEDMLDKIGVYFTFVFIFGISLGAYDPFSKNVRVFVALSSFLASFIPLLESFVWARSDKFLKIPANRTNTLTIGCLLSTGSLLPLLGAAFAPSERWAKNIFWISIVLQMISTVLPTYIVQFLQRQDSRFSRPAINIEHAAEKFEVLTMIFMGEAAIALLSEGAPLIAKEEAKAEKLYLAGFLCTAMLYSFQTLYVQVDNRILRRGKHALRHDAKHGIAWSALHMPYHLSLVLLATGLGLALRDVGFPPVSISNFRGGSNAIATVAHAASDYAAKLGTEPQFTNSARWLFSAGWGAAMICSGLLSLMHVGGPRAATKTPRLTVRFVVAGGITMGMPFVEIRAIEFLAIFTAVAAFLAIVEMILVQLDRVGLFTSEEVSISGRKDMESGTSGEHRIELGDISSEEAEKTNKNTSEQLENVEEDSVPLPDQDLETGLNEEIGDVPDLVARALKKRMTRGGESRLVRKQNSKTWHERRQALG